MLYTILDEIFKVYGQDEVDVGIDTDSVDTTITTDGGSGSGGGESSVIEEQSESVSSLRSTEAIADIGNYWDSIFFSIIVVAISIAAYFVIRYLVQKSADSLNIDRRQLRGINSITKMVIIVISVIVIIFHFSSLSGVAAGAISVAAGTIIGFSSRNTISNAIAGILLLSARPFKLGDRIRTTEDESLIGDVIEISLLYTKIKSIRNELVAIPNQTLLQRQIVNYSGLDVLSITVNVSLTYNNNRNLIEKILVDCAKETEGIVTSDNFPSDVAKTSRSFHTEDNFVTDPFVLLVKFGDYGAVYDLRAFTNKPREFLKITSELRKRIYDSFQKNGLDLTIPQAQKSLQNDIDDRTINSTRI
ncbi:MAG TPA: mechanosensitive ion channel domain-containing protein [Candidatus Saccharimonadales bacterium]|nr:mechanosensitive ion channel domain-containing protein [Candidatus Saccharimonadales bacterium]